MNVDDKIKTISDCSIIYNGSLKKNSYWKIGGIASYIIEPHNINGIQQALKVVQEEKLPYAIIGEGSNILFSDQGFKGAIIKLGHNFSKVTIKENVVLADAGVFVPFFVRNTLTHHLSGLEHCIGIPGNLGGLVAMNGGSNRKSISDYITKVTVVNDKNQLITYSKNQCGFSYRNSRFLTNNEIIVRVEFELELEKTSDIILLRQEMLSILKTRNQKFPRKTPNCGSVFASNPKYYKNYGSPGYLIEQCHLKGLKQGDAVISEQHANFFLNQGSASHEDILKLVQIARKKVHQKFGIWLECEARFLMPDGSFKPLHKIQ